MIDHHPFAYVVVPHDRRISAGIGIEIGDLDVCAAELCLPVAAFDGECFAIPFFPGSGSSGRILRTGHRDHVVSGVIAIARVVAYPDFARVVPNYAPVSQAVGLTLPGGIFGFGVGSGKDPSARFPGQSVVRGIGDANGLIGGGDSGPVALGMEESGQPTVHEFMHADEPCAAVVKSGYGFDALAKDLHIGGQGIDVLIEPGTGGYLSQGIVRRPVGRKQSRIIVFPDGDLSVKPEHIPGNVGILPTDVAVTDDERSKIGVIIRIEIRIEFVGFRTGTVVVGMREVKIAVTGRQCDHQSGTSDV